MDESLYDTSWILHTIPSLTTSFRAVLAPSSGRDGHQHSLSHHAEALRASLTKNRPRYEQVEEQERIGGLKQCRWHRLGSAAGAAGAADVTEDESRVGTKRKRYDAPSHTVCGLVISLAYDNATYSFIIYTSADESPPPAKRGRGGRSSTQSLQQSASESTTRRQPAILLSKSSPAARKALTRYLTDTFALSEMMIPLKLPSTLIQTTLERYLAGISTSLREVVDMEYPSQQATFRSIVGPLRLSIAFGPPVAPSLKTVDLNVPAHTVEQHYRQILDREAGVLDRHADFMATLATWILNKTGLNIINPPTPMNNNDDEDKENQHTTSAAADTPRSRSTPASQEKDGASDDSVVRGSVIKRAQSPPLMPMSISRISTVAYAISAEGRLKFASKPVELVDAMSEEGEGAGESTNLVRRANEELLKAVLQEASRQAREPG